MKLNELGEKRFLDALLSQLTRHPCFLNGFGDDARLLDIGMADAAVVMKIDRAGKPIAALRGWSDYRMWGALAVTANCSDILVFGGNPKGFMLSLSLPGAFEADHARDIVLGAQAECAKHNVAFLGGDTKESNEPTVIGAAVGVISKHYFARRREARPGDYLVLAGQLGGFVGAYSLMSDPRILNTQKRPFVDYMATPVARWVEAIYVNERALACSATDLSDGLFDAIKGVLAAGCGAVIDLDRLPYHPFARQAAIEYNFPLFNTAFGVGDWGMLFAVEKNKLERFIDAHQGDFSIIGVVIKEEGIFAKEAGPQEAHIVDGVINENFVNRMEDEGRFFDVIKHQITLLPVQDRHLKEIILAVGL